MDTFVTIIGGAAVGALITGIFSVLLFKLKRKADKEDKTELKQENFCQVQAGKIDDVKKTANALVIALRVFFYHIIKSECLKYLRLEKITAKDLEELLKMHEVYHDPDILNGNGLLDDLMEKVRQLPIVESYE